MAKKKGKPKTGSKKKTPETSFSGDIALMELALTIYISNDYAQNSDIGRWAERVIPEEVKKLVKDAKFVDGEVCIKMRVNEKGEEDPLGKLVEWRPLKGVEEVI